MALDSIDETLAHLATAATAGKETEMNTPPPHDTNKRTARDPSPSTSDDLRIFTISAAAVTYSFCEGVIEIEMFNNLPCTSTSRRVAAILTAPPHSPTVVWLTV